MKKKYLIGILLLVAIIVSGIVELVMFPAKHPERRLTITAFAIWALIMAIRKILEEKDAKNAEDAEDAER